MLVILKRKPEDPEMAIYELDSRMIPTYEADLKGNPMGIYDAGWDGFALIQNKDTEKYELRTYTKAEWDKEWCNIHNRIYGKLLISGACVRKEWNGKEYVIPEVVANSIYDDIRMDNIMLDIATRMDDLYEWIQPMFEEAGQTKDGMLEDNAIMKRIADKVDSLLDSNVAYNVTLENAIRQVLMELSWEKGGESE